MEEKNSTLSLEQLCSEEVMKEDCIDSWVFSSIYESIEEVGDEAVLYGHSDIKLFGTFDSAYKGNAEIIKNTAWVSSYEMAEYMARKNNIRCIACVTISTEGMLDLLSFAGINYINNLYKSLKNAKKVKAKVTWKEIVEHAISNANGSVKSVRYIKESGNVNKEDVISPRAEIIRIVDGSIIKNIEYYDNK